MVHTSWLSLLALASTAVCTAVQKRTAAASASLPGSTSTQYSALVSKSAGKVYFGSATDNPELTNSAYVAILSDTNYFAQLTPGNSMKWVRRLVLPSVESKPPLNQPMTLGCYRA
jgi:hypothetical protein